MDLTTRRIIAEGLPKGLDAESRARILRRLEELENDRAETGHPLLENWGKAMEAYSLGWRMPPSRHHVIVSPKSPVSTPQKLQEIAGMVETPQVIDTFYTDMDGNTDDAHIQADGKPEEVQVCTVSWSELVQIMNNTEHDRFLFVMVDGEIHAATLVKSVKADSTDEGEQEPREGNEGDN